MEERSTINTFQAFVPTFETDDSSLWQKPGLHMVSEAVMSGQQGGIILHGAMMGALAAYISEGGAADFQPMGANMGLLPPPEERICGKQER